MGCPPVTRHEVEEVIKNFPQLPSLDEKFCLYNLPRVYLRCCKEHRFSMKHLLAFREVYADNIYENLTTLSEIWGRHAATIHKRWSRKYDVQKRKGYLKAVWPFISEIHRPDIEAAHQLKVGRLTEAPLEACLWPHLNLEDLAKAEPLIWMVNSRLQAFPSAFADVDHSFCTYALVNDLVPSYTEVSKDFQSHQLILRDKTCPCHYGELAENKEKDCGTDCNFNTNVDDAIIILQIQQRVYQFLVSICRQILQDVTKAGKDLIQDFEALEKPPVFELETGNLTSLEAAAIRAPYRVPVKIDIQRMVDMVKAKKHAAEDHLQSIREDPAYFEATLKNWSEHSVERYEPHLAEDGSRHWIKFKSWNWGDELIGKCIAGALYWSEMWRELLHRIRLFQDALDQKLDPKVDRVHRQLPEYIRKQLEGLLPYLIHFESDQVKLVVSSFLVAPGVRAHYMEDNISRVNSKDHKHISKVFDLLMALVSPEKSLGGLSSWGMLDQLERLRKKDPIVQKGITPHVAKLLSDLSVISECNRQVMLFQPWTGQILDDLAHRCDLGEITGAEFKSWEESVSGLIMRHMSPELVKLATPEEKRFHYPTHKRRTKEVVAQLQLAEINLANF
ncbi:hypothetical protein BKA67DRAFT_646685 [Truncatella angustata]|uniref:Uncharacterized protein n=1 Tax=Truncatella angustata TaxID=152316 RepID=A0A9P8ZX43_9PEZI|nr:uncharacterized protein BKA67DRAFT_646685 [Truncatella angustata]KAH6652624.1 hypothetical protein BKA67DRAFT_646685 [Truncatella angustata]